MQLDEVFGLAAGAVECVVDVLGRALLERGDDVADIHAERAGLDPGDDTALAFPAFRPVAGLGIISQDQVLFLGPLDRAGIGNLHDLWIGLIKAPVFGFIIALAGCFQGMLVESNSEEVGQRTTTAVVQSIFLVIVLDAVFAVFFSSIGWR